MTGRQKGIAPCTYCGRMVRTDGSRYKRHTTTRRGEEICRMEQQHAPVTGLNASSMVARAHMVADLAQQVQDRDPSIVWDVLTGLPADELQRLTMIALAGIPVEDNKIADIWGWVCDLPEAKAATA